MAMVEGGFIFLTGDSQTEAPPDLQVECDHKNALAGSKRLGSGSKVGNPFELYFWDGKSGQAHLVGSIFGTFPSVDDIVKAEGLIVLPRPWSTPTVLSVLVFFDGIENGVPVSFEIPRSAFQNSPARG
jgi:hypothetical protein